MQVRVSVHEDIVNLNKCDPLSTTIKHPLAANNFMKISLIIVNIEK